MAILTPARGAFVDRRYGRIAADDDERELGDLGQRGERGVARQALDLARFGLIG